MSTVFSVDMITDFLDAKGKHLGIWSRRPYTPRQALLSSYRVQKADSHIARGLAALPQINCKQAQSGTQPMDDTKE